VIGAVIGIVIGFMVSSRGYSFASWLADTERSLGWLWAMMGAAVGAAVCFLRVLGR